MKLGVAAISPELSKTVRLCAIIPSFVTVNFTVPAGTSLWLKVIDHSLSVACTSVVAAAPPAAPPAAEDGSVAPLTAPASDGASAALLPLPMLSNVAWVSVGFTGLAGMAISCVGVLIAVGCASVGPVSDVVPQAAKLTMARSANMPISIVRPILLLNALLSFLTVITCYAPFI
jgi:hypothetical protein